MLKQKGRLLHEVVEHAVGDQYDAALDLRRIHRRADRRRPAGNPRPRGAGLGTGVEGEGEFFEVERRGEIRVSDDGVVVACQTACFDLPAAVLFR